MPALFYPRLVLPPPGTKRNGHALQWYAAAVGAMERGWERLVGVLAGSLLLHGISMAALG